MKKNVFSLHALNKIQILNKHQIFVNKNLITKIITKPDRIESGYKNRLVGQGVLDDKLYYEKIITIYPGRRSRYEKD